MKKIFGSFAFILSVTVLLAQKNPSRFPGFLIATNNDTIQGQIIVPEHSNNIELSNLFREVTYIDSTGKQIMVRPNEYIISFQFSNKNQNYYFERINLNDKPKKEPEYVFALRIIKGYISLYEYSFDTEYLNIKGALSPNVPTATTVAQRYFYYFLQKQNMPPSRVKRSFSFTSDVSMNNDKKWLKNYFRDYPELTKKIGRDIETYELEIMVKEYNDWKGEKKE